MFQSILVTGLNLLGFKLTKSNNFLCVDLFFAARLTMINDRRAPFCFIHEMIRNYYPFLLACLQKHEYFSTQKICVG